MKRLLSLLAFLCVTALMQAAKPTGAAETRSLIHKVNNTWISQHANDLSTAWDNSLYQLANMDAYLTTGEEAYLNHATQWAEANQWNGESALAHICYLRLYDQVADSRRYRAATRFIQNMPREKMNLPIFYALARATGKDSYADMLEKTPQTPLLEDGGVTLAELARTINVKGVKNTPAILCENFRHAAANEPANSFSDQALFAYGLMWGINSGLLSKNEYQAKADELWTNIKKLVKKDGSVNDGSTVSTATFLMAACERLRQQVALNNADRAYWCDIMYKLAAPILSNMAEGKLHDTMAIEVSPAWDGRDKGVTYMEAFGRLMMGLAPWLTLPDDDTEEGAMRKQLREWALKSYAQAVDPSSKDYLLWRKESQPLVDAAFIAESFLRAFDQLWVPLDEVTKQRYIEEFTLLRRVNPPYNNWLLFSGTVEALLAKAGANYDQFRITTAIRKIDEWYKGDGWYGDGPGFAFDYYGSYVIHPMYIELIQALQSLSGGYASRYKNYYANAVTRTQRFSTLLERFIAPDGTFPVFGRSIPYRMAAMQPLALMTWQELLPTGLTYGQVRAALTASTHRMFDGQENFNEKGFLTIGFVGRQPGVSDSYTNNGSLYMTSMGFLALGLPASHPFWTDAALPWTSVKAWNAKPFTKDHRISE